MSVCNMNRSLYIYLRNNLSFFIIIIIVITIIIIIIIIIIITEQWNTIIYNKINIIQYNSKLNKIVNYEKYNTINYKIIQ